MSEWHEKTNPLGQLADLSPEKLALLTLRLKQKLEAAASELNPLPDPGEFTDLSHQQLRLWAIEQQHAGTAVSNVATALHLQGSLHTGALARSWEEIVRRHCVLRTIFPSREGRPHQLISPVQPVSLEIVDIDSRTESEQWSEAMKRTIEDARRPFDLNTGPLWRVVLLRLNEADHVVLFTIHHIIFDGWSSGVLYRELAALYEAYSLGRRSPLPELPLQYSDFARRQQLLIDTPHASYWKQQLGGNQGFLDLPADRLRPATRTFRGHILTFELEPSLSHHLRDLSLKTGSTLFMLLLAAFKVLLFRYTGQDDLAVGTDIANRTDSDIELLIGFFVNQLVLRSDLSGDPSFTELLSRIRAVTLQAYAHQDTQFDQLVTTLRVERSLSHSPLFQVKFVLQNAPMKPAPLRGLTVTPVPIHNGYVGFDLILSMEEHQEGLRGALEYNTDLFDAATAERMVGHFKTLLKSIANNPAERISQLHLLTETEQQELLVSFNDTTACHPRRQCIHELFEAQVERVPDNVAAVFGQQYLTYKELNRRANKCARHLRMLGVGVGDVVGICMERSLDLLFGLLAILKAGSAYLPLDPAYPLERLAFMQADANAKVILSQEGITGDLPADWSGVICLDSEWELIESQSGDNLERNAVPEDLAYVIYTSGSTGTPKGVMIEHRGVDNLIRWQAANFSITENSRISQFSSYSFDAAVGETFMALLNGATLVMLDREKLDPRELIATINEQLVTVVVLVPSMLKQLDPELLAPDHQLTVVAVGEECPPALAKNWSKRCTFVNAYGPTEYTVYSHLLEVEAGQITQVSSIPIGWPIHNTRSYILDANLNSVPVGVVGELYLSGPGIARGYIGAPDTTAERFIPNPFYLAEWVAPHQELLTESALAEIEEFKKLRKGVAEIGSREQANDEHDISPDEALSLVQALDSDLVEKTLQFVLRYGDEEGVYKGFCRYLLEGAAKTYATAGINRDVLRKIFPCVDYGGLNGIDFGFGNGEIMSALADLGVSMQGIDYNPIFVQRGRERGDNVWMAKLDVSADRFTEETGIIPGSQDLATSTLTLDRLENPRNGLRNLFRSLKEGGWFVIQTLLPIVGTDDVPVKDPISYTPNHYRITPGRDAEQDRLLLLSLLHEFGARDVTTYRLPCAVSSRDGVQEYKLWSFTGRKDSVAGEAFHAGSYQRMYRTGDLARYLPDGRIEFRGRADNQVKINGIRIDFSETEQCLLSHQAVKDSLVTMTEGSGRKQITAYLAIGDNPHPEVSELRNYLSQKLPNYLIPTSFVMLESFPLLANGKLNRQMLPLPEECDLQQSAAFVAPSSPLESILAEAWCRVLGLEQVSIHDNIFEIGGDSILIMQILARIHQSGIHLTSDQFFKHQTIAELAAVAELDKEMPAEQTDVSGSVPLTPIQRWFFDQELPELHHYNQSILLELRGSLSASLLETAVAVLLAHHDALRLRFEKTETGWRQFNVGVEEQPAFSCISLTELAEPLREQALETAIKNTQASLSLSSGSLLRVVLFDYGPDQPGLLLIVIHHLAVDVVSWRILLDDLGTAARQLQSGEPLLLPAKTTSFKQWSEWLSQKARSLESEGTVWFWLTELQRPKYLRLPVDYPAGLNTEAVKRTIAVSLGTEETSVLVACLTKLGHARINELLLAALIGAIYRWIGAGSLLIDIEGHGRHDSDSNLDVSRTVGWFTSLSPLLVDLRESLSPEELLAEAKRSLRVIPGAGLDYGALRYLSQNVDALDSLRSIPSAEISFNYLGRFDQAMMGQSIFSRVRQLNGYARSPRGTRSYLLDVESCLVDGQLEVNFNYSARLHQARTIEKLAQDFSDILQRYTGAWASVADFPLAEPVLSKCEAGDRKRVLGRFGEIDDIYILTPLQQGILYHCLVSGDTAVYLNQLTCAVNGPLDVDVFKRVWQLVLDRNQVLRTAFMWQGLDEPLQVVSSRVRIDFEEQDWRSLSPAEQLERLESFLASDRAKGMALDVAPLMRLSLLRLGTNTHQFVWTFHHLLLDGWSVALLLEELFSLYESICKGQAIDLRPRPPFSEYIDWMAKQDSGEAEKFWRQELEGFTSSITLQTERNVESIPDRTVGRLRAGLNEVATHLRTFVRRHKLTVNTFMQAVWAILLSRYSGETDVVFGTVVAGRPTTLAESDSRIGLFINTLPVRVNVTPQTTLLSWLMEFQNRLVRLRKFEHTALVRIQEWSEIPRAQPLFKYLFIFENYPVSESLRKRESGLTFRNLRSLEQTNYPLVLTVVPDEEISLEIAYDPKRFSVTAVERLLRHYQQLLEEMVAHPEKPVSRLSLVSGDERERMLREWNETRRQYGVPQSLPELFEEQAARRAHTVALVGEGAEVSYGELNERANQLAHYLGELGVGPEVRVGVMLERGVEMVVGLLAVLKAGGCYLPLDPEYPAGRREWMVQDAGVKVLLSQRQLLGQLNVAEQVRVVYVDEEGEAVSRKPASNPGVRVDGANAAYIIYTSGSTGTPKGIIGTHQNTLNRFRWMWETYPFQPEEVCCQKTPLSFVDSIWEIFGPLVHGVTSVIVPDHLVKQPQALVQFLARHRVTRIVLVPSYLRAMLDVAQDVFDQLVRLRLWVCSGEELPLELSARLYDLLPDSVILNLYGSSEVAGDVTFFDTRISVEGLSARVPLGRPIDNTQLYILDEYLEPVPAGVIGALYVGGRNLSRGYLHRPELTAEKFIPDPFSRELGARLYETGDLARYLPDGNVEYAGRRDQQIKLRGMRIELHEIETLLKSHPVVSDAVVVVRRDLEDGRLIAFITEYQASSVTTEELRRFLKHHLPLFMIPSTFVTLDALPLLPNRKVDRASLVQSERRLGSAGRPDFTPPRTQAERLVMEIWQRALNLERVSFEESFFELGGHSLLLMKVHGEIQKAFKRELPLTDLFRYPTVGSLAKYLSQAEYASQAHERSTRRGKKRRDDKKRRSRIREGNRDKDE